ncbi:MAG: M1 family metallopeptidase [Gemmatimonadota bacterium]
MKALLLATLLALPQDTLPVPHAYLDALAAGTRDRSGAPGPRYWTNSLDYVIETGIDPTEARVWGREQITVHNRSPHTLEAVALNLNQNVFAPGNPRNRSVPVTGGFQLGRVVVQGTPVTHMPYGASIGTTNVLLPLSESVPPGASFAVEVDWSFEVPEGTFRMGREGTDVFYLAQWYPQVAVFDDLNGWKRDPYLGDGEFYVDYGNYDVRISAPQGWLVSASGVLQNSADVLTETAHQRLAALEPQRVTAVVSREDRDAGRMTATSASGVLTWHFVAENVRDFAWGTSKGYVWDATVAAYPDGSGGERTALIHSFYRPEQPNWSESARYAKHAIENHSVWYPYPYPQMTVNEGVIGGGMEYPMITIIGGGRTPEALYGVIAHELGHMWWPIVVGSNEKAHAWMDEGLASFAEDLTMPMLFPNENAGLNTMNGYLRLAGQDAETESMRPADQYGPFGNRGLASYGKPATGLRMLRAILGGETFDRALKEYTRRWAFKHPHALDLFWTFEDVSGQDLDWFFYPWMYTTRVIDQAVASVELIDGGRRARIVVEDRGEIRLPVHLVLEVEGQPPVVVDAGREQWQGRRMELTASLPGAFRRAVLDPDQMLADVDRSNNVATRR